MKKGFRSGSGRNSKRSEKPSNKGGNKGPSSGPTKSAQDSRDSRSGGPNSNKKSGPSDAKTFGSKSSRGTIKNARSLADVIGGKAPSGPSKIGRGAPSREDSRSGSGDRFGGGARGDMPTNRRGAPTSDRSQNRFDRDTPNAPTSKEPTSKKLTYIMSFNEQQGEVKPATPPARPAAGVRHSEKVEVNVGRPQNQDFKWPKGRVEKPAAKPEADSRSTGKKGARRVQGMVKRHPDGFGFLICDELDTPDVYISRQSMNGIMTNDRVEVELYSPRSQSKGKEDRLSGEVVKILKRSNSRVVGKYLPVDAKYGVLMDDGKGWGADLRIAAGDSMDAKDGEMVAVEILQYPDHDHEFTGRVVSILGDVEDPVNDVIRVVHQSGIPTEFSKEAVNDAKKFGGKVTEAECRERKDLRDLDLITIDGSTARDFDDAIFTEKTADGFRLIVAIADVSHYVKPGTRLDEEAYERGTSTYFPNFVVPMLPEELSNELCSLKPDVERLCFVCEMQIDYQGEIQDYKFYEGVMLSKARVIYGEAQEVIDSHAAGTQNGSAAARRLKHVEENILRSADLAKILMAKRFREGSLDLEIPETQVVVDSTGESVDIIRSERLFAHRLIEELMLVTNICTARFLDEAQIPGIYRIHDEPDPDAIQSLQRYLWNLGGSRSVMGSNLAKKLTKALESMKGKPEAQILNILTLRTMQQAKYSAANIGHFGLGFSHYSHFTSPIRRYPDLIAHRIIKSQIYPKYGSMQMSDEELQSATTWLSACEQRSVKAERKVISIKKARFMRKFIGEEFDGIISSVAKFGVFVMLRQFDVDGLVKIENLGNDRFMFDEDNLRLIGPRTGLRYVIGDLIRVRVAGSDPESGKVDFELANAPVANPDGDEDEEHGLDEFNEGFGRLFKRESSGVARTNGPRGAKGPKERESGGKKKRFGAKERSKTADDSSGVRKKRFSKRRGKN